MPDCTKCKLPKPSKRFRIRTKNRYTWRNGKCMDCEAKEQLKRYYADIEHSRKVERERQRKFRKDNPSLYNELRNEYRRKNRVKVRKWETDWYARNEAGRKKHRVRASKWHEKNRGELSDTYVKNKLSNSNLKPNEITQELIELHRLNIAIKRVINVRKNKARLSQV